MGVNHSWLYARLRDIKKYKLAPKYLLPESEKPQKPIRPEIDVRWSYKKIVEKAPHFALYLFASGHIDDTQLATISVRNRNLEFELSKVSQGCTLSEVVRDYPILLLRTMVRFEVFEPQKQPDGVLRPAPKVSVTLDPFKEVANSDPDKFDPRSPLMRDIARLALGFAAD